MGPGDADGADDEESDNLASHLHSHLVVATPVADASHFLERKVVDQALGREWRKDFEKARIAAAFIFTSSLELPFNFAAFTAPDSVITVAICDSSRRAAAGDVSAGSGHEEVWVVQTSTAWADRVLEAEEPLDALAEQLLSEFAAALGLTSTPSLRGSAAFPWVYGDKDYFLESGCVWIEELQLSMAGDWAYNGRVEGAWLSGMAAAKRVLAARSARGG